MKSISYTRALNLATYAERPPHISLWQRLRSRLSKRNWRLVWAMQPRIQRPWDVLNAARFTGLELPIACALLESISKGGHNYFSHKFVSEGALPSSWYNSAVTELKYRVYWAKVEQGKKTVPLGPTQIDSIILQYQADLRGGSWIPLHNLTEGFSFFGLLIEEAGLQGAFSDYKNQGEDFGVAAIMLVNEWREILGI